LKDANTKVIKKAKMKLPVEVFVTAIIILPPQCQPSDPTTLSEGNASGE
jgi:hypothetical protein